jgi:hypothetical protein
VNPIAGSRSDVAETLSRIAAAGIGHIQVVLDPIDAAAIEELGEVARLVAR